MVKTCREYNALKSEICLGLVDAALTNCNK